MTGFVELSKVGKTYEVPHHRTVIVENFDLDIAKGEFVSLLGHRGCGKSTILTMVAGLTAVTDGGIFLDGLGVDGPGPDRGIVFPSPGLIPWMSVLDNVLLSIIQSQAESPDPNYQELAGDLLQQFHLADVRDCKAAELSLATQQRIGIARAVASNPKMLLLDEPFAMLDGCDRVALQDLLLEVHSRYQLTTMMITHDIDEALLLSDRIVLMTNAPKSTIGQILDVSLERPRERKKLANQTQYRQLQQEVSMFLDAEDRTHAA